MSRMIDMLGLRVGRLTVIERAPNYRTIGGALTAQWLCRCECGAAVTVRGSLLRKARTKSCGCLKREMWAAQRTVHGESKRNTVEYRAWKAMRSRCSNPNLREWPLYGGAGITVCQQWGDFAVFLTDMGRRPKGKTSVDRIDRTRGYEPGNCRWATQVEQMRNTRSNRMISWNGETLSLAEWAERTGINYHTLHTRLGDGWTVQRALTLRARNVGSHSTPQTPSP